MLSFNISYWDSIKFPSFADTTERRDKGWKDAQRHGEARVTWLITLLSSNLSNKFKGINVLEMKVLEVTILKLKVKKVTTRNFFSEIFYIKILSKTSPTKTSKITWIYTRKKFKKSKTIVGKWQYLWKKTLVTTIWNSSEK